MARSKSDKSKKADAEEANGVDKTRLPRHIAIIMDGNGRWAKKRGLPRIAGHSAGVESVRQIVETCREIGVPYLTLYAFSSENWTRPSREVNALMRLLKRYLKLELNSLNKNSIRVNTIGGVTGLPTDVYTELENAKERTSDNDGMVLTLALNYGSHNEILEAVRAMAARVKSGEMNVSDIDEETFSNALQTQGIPDPDLLIRTSGEYRLSNFLLWQLHYAELVFVETLWPDFSREDLYKAIAQYQRRERRFGGDGST
ncbi:isoprenyl transferase [Candidatus Hydrogenedentota bacterium]